MNSIVDQKVVFEGPILISATEVIGEFVMKQLRDKIVSAIRKNQIKNDPSTRVLILSGSHGDGDSGSSGLSDISRLKDPSDNNPGSVTNTFYEGDCLRAGLKPVRLKLNLDNLPLAADQIPDVMKMRKLNPLFLPAGLV